MIIIREKAPDKLDHTVQVAKEFPRKTLSLAKTVKEVARLYWRGPVDVGFRPSR